MTLRVLMISAVLAGGALPAIADEIRERPSAVMELFTSQGCSSCPPADKLLADYAERDDIVALAYHVDYWDYIGWPDTFGSAANSDLQRAYARALEQDRIYTPQLMINGVEDVVGSRRSEAAAAVARADLTLPVALEASATKLEVSVPARPGLEEAMVWLVTFRSGAEVAIERGENRGRTLRYEQIVIGRQILGMWEPDTGAHIKLPLAEVLAGESDGAAVIVQRERHDLPGEILGAASFTRASAD